MRTTRIRLALAFTLMAMGLLVGNGAPSAEEGKVAKKQLLKQELTIADREAVMIAVELQPGASEGRHTHPAELLGFVREGELTLEQDGKQTVAYKAGEAFYVPPGTVHNGMNKTTGVTRVTATLIAEKGKPLSTPAQ